MKRRGWRILLVMIFLGSLIVPMIPLGPFGGGLVSASPDDDYGFYTGTYIPASGALYWQDTSKSGIGCMGSDGTRYAIVAVAANGIQLFKQAYGTGSWTLVSTLIGTYNEYANNYGRSMVIDSNDYLHAVVARSSGSGYQLRHIKANTSGSLIFNNLIFDGYSYGTMPERPSLSIDGNDVLHLVFDGESDGNTYSDILYASGDTSGSWGSISILADGDSAGYDQYTPEIRIGPDNQRHVVWYGKGWGSYATNYSAMYIKTVGEVWQSPTVIYNQIDHHHYKPALAVDGSGYVHVVWIKQDSGATPTRWVYYSVNTGSGFGTSQEVSAYLYAVDGTSGPKECPAVVTVSQDGKIHCAWKYGSATADTYGYCEIARRVGGLWETRCENNSTARYHPISSCSYWPRHHGESLNIPEVGCKLQNLVGGYDFYTSDFDDAAIRFTPYVNTGAQTAQEGVTNHQLVADYTPNFSAIYPYRLGMTSTATHYRVVVKDGTNFDTAVTYWDSGQQALSPTCSQGSRCHDIVYGNVGSPTALDDETPRLYWLIKFWDSLGAETEWSGTWTSNTVQYFQVCTGAEYWNINLSGYLVENPLGGLLQDSLTRRYDGRLYIASRAAKPSTAEYNAIVFYSDNDGEDWSNLGLLLPSSTESVNKLSIACDSDGTLHLVASVDDGTNIDIYYYYMLYGSSSWSSASLLLSNMSVAASSDPEVRLRCDEDDNLHCVVHDKIFTQFRYAKYTYGLGWASFVALGGDFDAGTLMSWDLVICDDQIALVIGDSSSGLGVAVRDVAGSTWVYLWLDSPGVIYDTPPYLDGGGRCPQATYDPDNDDLVISVEINYNILGAYYPFASIWRVHLPNVAVSTTYGNTDDYWYRYYLGYAYKSDADYATARTAATGTAAGSTQNGNVGQNLSGSYYVWRGGMRFDCRNWPSGTVSEAYVTFYNSSDGSGTPTVHAVDGDYLDWPMTTADYGEIYTYGTASFGSAVMSSLVEKSITLNSSGIAKVQAGLGDYTQFALRTTDDMNGTPPTGSEFRTVKNEYDDTYLQIPRLYAKIDGTWYTSGYWDIDEKVVTWALNNTSNSDYIQVTRSLDNKFHYSFYKVLSDVNGAAGWWRRTWDESTQTWEDAEHLDSLPVGYVPCISDVQFPSSAVANEGYFFTRRGSLFYGISEDGSWPEEPQKPLRATNGYCEGVSSSPTGPTISDFAPEFSAVYNDPNTGDIANRYWIQVGTDNDWGTAEMWDSGEQIIASCTEGTRCSDIEYAGSSLDYDTTYYWRIKFRDDGGLWAEPPPSVADWSWDTGNSTTWYEFTTEEFVAGAPSCDTVPASGYEGGTTAQLNGELTATGGSTPIDYRFIYDTDSGYPYSYNTSWVNGTLNTPGETFDESISTTPGMTYYFRAQVRNINGTGTGDELSFAAGGGPPSISTQPASNISVSSARLNGYLSSDGGEASYVRFQYNGATDYLGSGDDTSYEIYTNHTAGQTFEASTGYTANGVLVKIYREGSPGTLTAQLTDVSGDLPGSTVHASGTIAESEITTSTSGAWYSIEFSVPYTLSNGTDYGVVLTISGGDTSNSYHWFRDSGAGYADGQACYYDGSWHATAGQDAMFGVYTAWLSTGWVGGYTTGNSPREDIEPLSSGCPYRFRAQAYNSYNGIGSPVSGDTETFATYSEISKPTDLVAMGSSDTAISLSWSIGTGAQRTKIIYQIGAYPASPTEAGPEEGYFGTGSSCTISALVPGTLYYFAAFSYAPGDIWSYQEPFTGFHTADTSTDADEVYDDDDELWSQDSGYYEGDLLYNETRSDSAEITDYTYSVGVGVLTLAGNITGQVSGDSFYIYTRSLAVAMTYAGAGEFEDPYSVPDTPNWFFEPSNTALSYLPGRGIIEQAATTLGVSIGTTFCFLMVILAIIVGFMAFLATRNPMAPIVGIAIILLIGLRMEIVPGWIFFLFLIVGSSTGYILSKGSNV